MTEFFSNQLIAWMTLVDLPVITAFLVTFSRLKRDVEREASHLRDRLGNFKLNVAQNYASVNQVKDLESRLIAHLLRIETKLDNTALKAHAVYANPNPSQRQEI